MFETKMEVEYHEVQYDDIKAHESGTDSEIMAKIVLPKAEKANIIQPHVKPSVKIEEFKNLKAWTKKSACPYCMQDVTHFPRHLQRKHNEEGAVKELFAMPLKDPKRKCMLNAIRREGNFATTSNTNFIRPIRRPKSVSCSGPAENLKNLKEEYVACKDCLGYFKRNYLRLHRRKCALRSSLELSEREQHLSTAQLFAICSGVHHQFYATLRLKNEVFPIMRNDAISSQAMYDKLVCCYAENLLKHKGTQIKNVISNKMRELGRLLLCLKNLTGLQKLFDLLKPQFFDSFVAATKVISGYDPETGSFKTSSLPLHMGTSLKQVCDVAAEMVIQKSPFFPCAKPDETLKEIKVLKKLIETSWHCKITSLVSKNPNGRKYQKTKLPLTDSESPDDHGMEELKDSSISQNLISINDYLEGDVKKKNITRVRWEDKQKKLIKSHFENHIKNKKAPNKKEAVEFIEKFNDIFQDRNWVTVKAFVYNCYK
ncbi:unnamed protein product [Brassicogethes aeneus]|uniref:Uncharacterized protein n=1 Tax=Brassicogethes aeneus TaxID=1431903 RepID=A0A9P0FC35_BRAAE|nr:unnamed protein product [Brassicogethes aeneus]